MGLIFDGNIGELYETWYDSPQGRAIDKSIEPLTLALLSPRPGERVLDIGCGTGNHILTFSKLGMDVSGMDASPQMIGKARKRLGHRCTLKTGMAEDLPFEDNEFDMAVLINTLEFLDNPLHALREAGRVANKKVFIGVINSLSWNGILNRIQGCFGDPLFSHARLYNLWQLKALLRTAYGHVPVSWVCTKIMPAFIEEMRPFGKDLLNSKRLNRKRLTWKRSAFGSFLGISATMVYRAKTDNLRLKIKLKKTGQPLIGAKPLEHSSRSKGVYGDERGLSV